MEEDTWSRFAGVGIALALAIDRFSAQHPHLSRGRDLSSTWMAYAVFTRAGSGRVFPLDKAHLGE